MKRLVFAFLLCLVLVVPAAHGIESSSDWQSRIDREIGKMREEAARLHEEGNKLWNTGARRGRAGGNSVEEGDKQVQPRDRQKQEVKEDDKQAQPPDRQSKEEDRPITSHSSHHELAPQPDLPQDDAKIVLQLTSAAERGDARAQCALGTLYAYGRGVPKDEAKAVQLYEAAAGQENADAQYALGWMYAHGRGVPRDEAKAVQWCLKAVERGLGTRASCQNLRRTAK